MFRVVSIESKVRKLCITQGFTLGVKGLTNSTTVKYCSTVFQWSHFRVLYMESKVRKLCITQGFTLGVKGLTNSTTVKYCSTVQHYIYKYPQIKHQAKYWFLRKRGNRSNRRKTPSEQGRDPANSAHMCDMHFDN